MNNVRQLREKGLTTVFESVGIVLFSLLQLKDIHCLFRTSRGFNVFLYQLLRGIAHSTKNTIGSQGSGFDGSLISYVRWMFPDVPSVLFSRISCCLHAGINAGNIFDIAKIVYFKPIRDIKISIGDGSSSSEFFEYYGVLMIILVKKYFVLAITASFN